MHDNESSMEEQLITEEVLDEFIQASGVDATLARRCLLDHKCDLIAALKAHERRVFAQLNAPNNNNHSPNSHKRHRRLPSMEHAEMSKELAAIQSPTLTRLSPTAELADEQEEDDEMQSSTALSSSSRVKTSPNGVKLSPRGTSYVPQQCCHIETPSYTFTLPNLAAQQPREFRAFLEKDLIETSTLRTLENSGHLNWWVRCEASDRSICERLFPLSTSGDGNCLLHAASLGMWGFHDRLLILRNALHALLTNGQRRHALWRRWRWQQASINKQSGLEYTEAEWSREWSNLVRLASAEPRQKVLKKNDNEVKAGEKPQEEYEPTTEANTYESLEDIHVFALAHVLKRPIVVIADTVLRSASGDALAPIPFGGIYLPLECTPESTHKAPLVLVYDAAHFSALVAMAHDLTKPSLARPLLPLTDAQRRLLPVHFACDPGADYTWGRDPRDAKIARAATLDQKQIIALICRYMDITIMKHNRIATTLPASASTHERLAHIASSTLNTRHLHRMLKDRLILRRRRSADSACVKRTPSADSTLLKRCQSKEIDQTCGNDEVMRVTAALGSHEHLICARLRPDTHHQYMKEMIDTYLTSARKRYEESKRTASKASTNNNTTPSTTQPASTTPTSTVTVTESCAANRTQYRRARGISRAMGSAEELVMVECMNGNCVELASHATNYLCESCFHHQQEVMASFSGSSHRRTSSNGHANWSPSHSKSPSYGGRMQEGATATVVSGGQQHHYNTLSNGGVIRYYAVSVTSEGIECRSALCANYSNGCTSLCAKCAERR